MDKKDIKYYENIVNDLKDLLFEIEVKCLKSKTFEEERLFFTIMNFVEQQYFDISRFVLDKTNGDVFL